MTVELYFQERNRKQRAAQEMEHYSKGPDVEQMNNRVQLNQNSKGRGKGKGNVNSNPKANAGKGNHGSSGKGGCKGGWQLYQDFVRQNLNEKHANLQIVPTGSEAAIPNDFTGEAKAEPALALENEAVDGGNAEESGTFLTGVNAREEVQPVQKPLQSQVKSGLVLPMRPHTAGCTGVVGQQALQAPRSVSRPVARPLSMNGTVFIFINVLVIHLKSSAGNVCSPCAISGLGSSLCFHRRNTEETVEFAVARGDQASPVGG